jgi:hypothetical protein
VEPVVPVVAVLAEDTTAELPLTIR